MKKLLSVLLFLLSLTGFAQSIATYTFTAADPGSQSSKAVTTKDANIAATDIIRGPGTTTVATGSSINSSGWDSPSQDPNDYYQFTLTPNPGRQLNLSTINIPVRRSNSGPVNYLIAYSINNGTDVTAISGPISVTTDVTLSANLNFNTPFAVRFRLYAWGASSSAGTLRLNNTLTVNGSAPLPVKLLSFTGQLADKAVVLNWATAWEEKNEGFDILKGSSATSFENVGFVAGKTTTQELSTYSFTDTDVKDGQVYYYQLRQKDIGGGSELSKIIAVRFRSGAADSGPMVYPNPNRGSFSVSAKDISAISLFNSSGVEIPVTSSQIPGSTTLSVDVKTPLPTGLYHLRLQAADGTYKQSVKVVVQ